jgi:hypothetical protein
VHGKLTLGFNLASNRLVFFMAAAPVPSIPFATHDVKGSAFAPALLVLTDATEKK